MKVARLLLILSALSLLAVACDSQTLLDALLGPSSSGDTGPQPPAIVTATPPGGVIIVTATPPGGVIVVTATPAADAVVTQGQLNMRRGPSTWFRVIKVLNGGDPLTIIGRNGNYSGRQLWLEVQDLTGQQGWVAGWLLTLNRDINTVPIVATPIPPPTWTPSPTLTPVPTGPIIEFWADNTRIPPGTCTTIRWRTENIREVYFEGMGVTGSEDRTICPPTTQTYTLRVVLQDGTIQTRTVTVFVGDEPSVNFRADRYQIGPSECTTLRWDVEGVSAVYLEGVGVIGHDSRLVCPGATKTYTLRTVRTDGVTNDYWYVTVQVDPAYGP